MASNYYVVTWKNQGDRFADKTTGVWANSPEEARRIVLSTHRGIEIVKIEKR